MLEYGGSFLCKDRWISHETCVDEGVGAAVSMLESMSLCWDSPALHSGDKSCAPDRHFFHVPEMARCKMELHRTPHCNGQSSEVVDFPINPVMQQLIRHAMDDVCC